MAIFLSAPISGKVIFKVFFISFHIFKRNQWLKLWQCSSKWQKILKHDGLEFYNRESQKADNITMAVVIRASYSINITYNQV